jgi:L-lactate dehydrogenase complex protein LldF
MCTTLPRTLVTVMGIEKVLPRWEDLGVMLQLLPRSSTGERMNPYTSLWTGIRPGDGPQEFHLVLVDAGRTLTLADPVGREALHCIRCSACLNVCPVYERAGGTRTARRIPGRSGRSSPRSCTASSRAPTCRGPRRCAAPATRRAR